jgi:hypothetical protein
MVSRPKGNIFVPVWVDGREVKALVDANGRISVNLAAQDNDIDVNLAASDITLGVTESSPLTSIQAQMYGYFNSNWQKQGLMPSYYVRSADAQNTVSSGAGTTSVETTAIGYYFLLKAQQYYFYHNDTVARSTILEVTTGSVSLVVNDAGSLAPNTAVYGNIDLLLKTGDTLKCTVASLASGKTVYLNVWGVLMGVNL